jgi:hypothetical protein
MTTLLLLLVSLSSHTQTIDLTITKGSDLVFSFNTIRAYRSGVIIGNATEISIESTVEWDLYVGTQTTVPGFWDLIESYSDGSTDNIPVDILSIRANSSSLTSREADFITLRDVSNPIYLIGTIGNDPTTSSGVGTNEPGSARLNPLTHRFRASYRLKPGLLYSPGIYSLEVVFTIAEDL